jgi:hypothetical protein
MSLFTWRDGEKEYEIQSGYSASLKYFIIQVLASATLLFLVVIKTLTEDLFSFDRNIYTPIIIYTPLLLKSGAAPHKS